MRVVLLCLGVLLAGCVIEAPPREPPPPVAEPPPPPPEAAVYEQPPVGEPVAVAVGWAPPPMLVEAPPPAPFLGAVWVGGYWVWRGNWVWASGHWMAPPQPQYVWVHPYYEHRGGQVIFINGYWSAPGVAFVPPPPGLMVVEPPAVGVIPGPRPIGPEGCFVPAPPGSRAGIIIPAPVGTAPAVVTSAPPVVAVGMRVTNNVTNVNNTNITQVTNITNVTRVTNVTIVAPATATANGRGFSSSIPAAPHLAAALPAVVQAHAPKPPSMRPVAPYASGQNANGGGTHAQAVSVRQPQRDWPQEPQEDGKREAQPSHPAHPAGSTATEHPKTAVHDQSDAHAKHPSPAPAKPSSAGSAAAHPAPAASGDAKEHKAEAKKQQGHDEGKREHDEGHP